MPGETDIDFLCQVCRVAVDAGATVLNLPDTVGYAVPENTARCSPRCASLWAMRRDHAERALPRRPGHGGVANSLAAIRAGVRQIECPSTVSANAAGNASLEEVVVALAVAKDSFGVTTGIRMEELFPTSRMLTEITGAQVAPNKAIVGANAFAHEAGIHQDGIIKNPLTYEIIRRRRLECRRARWSSEKHSGRMRCA